MRELARAAAVLALATVACAGGGPRGHVNASSRVGPADVTARRALLARFSPKGEAIVAAYEALPTRYELPEGPYTVSSSDTFDGYFRDSAIENVVAYAFAHLEREEYRSMSAALRSPAD